MIQHFVLIFIISVSIYSVSANTKIIGVAPERLSLYDSSKPFACLDGSATIPFGQVNDDYCDCRDGSDEPGTAACLNGSFACENLGYIVQMIPSSRVNDGICDCCDGSDEYTTNANCENKCIELAAKMKEEEEKLKLLRDQGMVKRKELIDQGSEIKKELQSKLLALESRKINAELERKVLEDKKNQAEQMAKEAKEKQDKLIEAQKNEEKAKLDEAKCKELFDKLDIDKDGSLRPEEIIFHQELDVLFDNNGHFTLEEAVKLLDNIQKIDLLLFKSNYCEKIAPHIKFDDDPQQQQQQENKEGEQQQQQQTTEDSSQDQESGQQENNNQPEELNENQEPIKHENTHGQFIYDAETQALIDESNKARSLFDDSERKYNEIEREMNDINKKLTLDTGSQHEFASMVDQCFEMEDREYIYKLCPFDRTVQKSKSNNAETVIGYWGNWGEIEASKYSRMKYQNGLACWNGPQRSTLVHLICGIENKLIAVSEPNRCEYEMKFETPALCDHEGAVNESHSHQHEDL